MGTEASSLKNEDQEVMKKKLSISKNDEMIRKNVRTKICYPMKIIIRGSRKTGKTTLFKRLQGDPFIATYNETPEIQISQIHWEQKNSDDYSKIDIWDVDDGYLPSNRDDTSNDSSQSKHGKHRYQPLDSKAVDVYKNTNLVIFLIDPFSQKSFDYVKRIYEEVPLSICILIILNFKDLSLSDSINNHSNSNSKSICITKEIVLSLADEIRTNRMHKYKMGSFIAKSSKIASPNISPRSVIDGSASSMECGAAFFLETSMLNCYGLKDLYRVSLLLLLLLYLHLLSYVYYYCYYIYYLVLYVCYYYI